MWLSIYPLMCLWCGHPTPQSVREELTEMEEHHDELSVIESLMAGGQNRPTTLPGAPTKGTPSCTDTNGSLSLRTRFWPWNCLFRMYLGARLPSHHSFYVLGLKTVALIYSMNWSMLVESNLWPLKRSPLRFILSCKFCVCTCNFLFPYHVLTDKFCVQYFQFLIPVHV